MSVLDDLFSAAAELWDQPRILGSVLVEISITISPKSPFPTEDTPPGSIGLGWGELYYTPSKAEKLGKFGVIYPPAFFEGEINVSVNQPPPPYGTGQPTDETIGLSIIGPRILQVGPVDYGVTITFPATSSVGFTPQPDPTTNVIYGAEEANFIAISLGAVGLH
jgi:hypothetical protein